MVLLGIELCFLCLDDSLFLLPNYRSELFLLIKSAFFITVGVEAQVLFFIWALDQYSGVEIVFELYFYWGHYVFFDQILDIWQWVSLIDIETQHYGHINPEYFLLVIIGILFQTPLQKHDIHLRRYLLNSHKLFLLHLF